MRRQHEIYKILSLYKTKRLKSRFVFVSFDINNYSRNYAVVVVTVGCLSVIYSLYSLGIYVNCEECSRYAFQPNCYSVDLGQLSIIYLSIHLSPIYLPIYHLSTTPMYASIYIYDLFPLKFDSCQRKQRVCFCISKNKQECKCYQWFLEFYDPGLQCWVVLFPFNFEKGTILALFE